MDARSSIVVRSTRSATTWLARKALIRLGAVRYRNCACITHFLTWLPVARLRRARVDLASGSVEWM